MTYDVAYNGTDVTYGAGLIMIFDSGKDPTVGDPTYVHLQCWAVEEGTYDPPRTPVPTGPYTAVLKDAIAEPEAPVAGPPPPTIKPHGNVASALVLAAASFQPIGPGAITLRPKAPSGSDILILRTATTPLAIKDLSTPLAAAAGPGEVRRYHVYIVADPAAKHPLNNTTIAIPVALK
jgi:hypothetical protein